MTCALGQPTTAFGHRPIREGEHQLLLGNYIGPPEGQKRTTVAYHHLDDQCAIEVPGVENCKGGGLPVALRVEGSVPAGQADLGRGCESEFSKWYRKHQRCIVQQTALLTWGGNTSIGWLRTLP